MDLESLFAQYGYLALIFGSFADGTPIMLFGGFAAHRGWLELIPFVILAGAVGNFAAATAWFFGVRAIGEKILTRRPEWAAQVAKVRAQLDRWKVPVIMGVRFLPGIATAGLIAVAVGGCGGGSKDAATPVASTSDTDLIDPGNAPIDKSFETPDKANAVFVAGVNLNVQDTDPDYAALVRA